MQSRQRAFQINCKDNVATALTPLVPGRVVLLGDAGESEVVANEEIAIGHKIALRDMESGEDVVKYGVVIGRTIRKIKMGEWVHLHSMRSLYDERSGHLDVVTGAPGDINYE